MILYLLHKYHPNIPFTMFLGAHDLEEKYQGSLYTSKYSKKIFTHSYENINDLISFGIERNKIEVLHRGTIVDDNILSTLESKSFDEPKLFLTAGRLIKEKGTADVIEIF